MKLSRVVVLGVAAGAGLIAMVLALNLTAPASKPEPPPAKQVDLNTEKVLVATRDLAMGSTLTATDVAWRDWPKDSVSGEFITGGAQDSETTVVGAIARARFYTGEPISNAKLIRTDRGFMSAILPEGKRAVAVRIAADTSAGGFILPNDHVDVVLTSRDRRAEKATGTETFVSRTILSDVRVLAIGQQVGEKNGQKVVIGKTATLELTPKQVESVELARKTGTLSLALRSIADIGKRAPKAESDGQNERDAVNVVRFGVTTASTPH